MKFRVRGVSEHDVTAIHAFGANAPELNVGGAGGRFPTLDELDGDIEGADWLVVEDERGNVWGFICARCDDPDRLRTRSACIVYLFVEQRHRGKGLAKMLWDEMCIMLGVAGVQHIYTWANPDSGAVEFFKKQGLIAGKPCVWMDVSLSGPDTASGKAER